MAERLSFIEQLETGWKDGKLVSVGLDADLRNPKYPAHLRILDRYESQYRFLRDIITATADLVLAYKPNIAFFEDDPQGEGALKDIVAYIHQTFPRVPIIVDAKRGDISNTNNGYARTLWERYSFDATTVHSYLGKGTYPPFLNYEGKGIIAMCKTSNPDAPVIQDLIVNFADSVESGAMTKAEQEELSHLLTNPGESPVTKSTLYLIMAYRHEQLRQQNPNIGIVVGATHPESFEPVRRIFDGPILIPGIGTQGGDLEKTLRYAPNSQGTGMIINSSSGIIFASRGEDFAEAARVATLKLDKQIRELRGI